ncbi:MAG: hypothetical protein Q8K12_18750, partial [Thiobacillus sp.]|nr:hypothetical protein [Thiobacillus sp.]
RQRYCSNAGLCRRISSRSPLSKKTKFALRFLLLRLTAVGGRLDDSQSPLIEKYFKENNDFKRVHA